MQHKENNISYFIERQLNQASLLLLLFQYKFTHSLITVSLFIALYDEQLSVNKIVATEFHFIDLRAFRALPNTENIDLTILKIFDVFLNFFMINTVNYLVHYTEF